jgi:hypothetical protein
MVLVATMAIGLLIPPTGCSTAQPSFSASAETGQPQQSSQCGTFSVLLKDAVQNIDNGQTTPLPDADGPIESTPSAAVDDHATGAALIGIVVVSLPQVPDTHEVATSVEDKAESVPTANANASANPNPTGPTIQNIESTSLLLQGLTVVVSPDDGTPGHEPVAANPSPSKTTNSSGVSLPQPAINPDGSSVVPTTPVDSPTTKKPASRNGRGAPVHLVPVPLEQPSEASALSGTRPPGSLSPDQGSPHIMENQGSTNPPPAAQGQGNALVQSLVRPSADIRPSAMIQEQGDHETTLLSQSQSVRVIQDSGGGEHGSFSDLAQGEGEGSLFQFTAGGVPESVTRGHQSPLFIDQFMSARQTPSSPEGTGSPVVMSTTDHLKLTQSLLSGDRSGTMTSMSGMPQTIYMQLPSHDSGPLNVRISMIDQTVHTQFTTDRSDLGALLFIRQDQLQQNLIKSGLELGQFQVHVNQEGRQDALPDRQSRRNDGTPEQQLASQDHNPQAQDRDRPNHRPLRALSLFA